MDVDALTAKLQEKIVQEFNYLISKVKKGYLPKLEFLLEEISTLEIYKEIDEELSRTMLQFYINHQWKES